jgi:hypothetical protein
VADPVNADGADGADEYAIVYNEKDNVRCPKWL